MEKKRIEALDSIRGMAAIIVVIFHCLINFEMFNNANYNNQFVNGFMEIFTVSPLHIIWAGNEAVLLFFILSGFVMVLPYLEGRKPDYGSYMIKRFCRIYLPYIIIMGVSVLLTMIFWKQSTITLRRWDHPVGLKSILSYLIMYSSDLANVNGVVWTLFIEMKLSIVAPIIAFIVTRFKSEKSLPITIVTLIALNYLIGYTQTNFNLGILNYLLVYIKDPLYYSIFFFIGATIAKEKRNIESLPKNSLIYKVLLFSISLFLINCRWLPIFFGIENMVFQDIISASGIALLFILVFSSKEIAKSLTHRFFLWVGKISFSLYLVHIPVLGVVTFYLVGEVPKPIAFALGAIASLPVAYMTHKYIEVPAAAIGKKYAGKYKSFVLKRSSKAVI